LIAGSDGNLWFAEAGAQADFDSGAGRIGRITTAGTLSEFSTGLNATSEPEFITKGPDGNMWFTDNQGFIGNITTDGVINEQAYGLGVGQPLRGITAGPDGALWFALVGPGRIGRLQ
jgi:streptogramin lyase